MCNGETTVHQQKLSVRCDNMDLASQCGLSVGDLLRSGHYLPGQLRFKDELAASSHPSMIIYFDILFLPLGYELHLAHVYI